MYRFLYANPLVIPEQMDFLNIGGAISPGVFKLEGGTRPYKWDVKDAAGTEGATETYRGFRPSDDIKGKFLFWTRQQIDEFFNKFVALLHYDASKKAPKPISVLHPVLAANGIANLITKSVGPLTHEDGKQLWSVTVEFMEYIPAKKKNATTTPTSTKTAAGANEAGKPTVLTARQQTIKDLTAVAFAPLP